MEIEYTKVRCGEYAVAIHNGPYAEKLANASKQKLLQRIAKPKQKQLLTHICITLCLC